jgi:hypothetical protein
VRIAQLIGHNNQHIIGQGYRRQRVILDADQSGNALRFIPLRQGAKNVSRQSKSPGSFHFLHQRLCPLAGQQIGSVNKGFHRGATGQSLLHNANTLGQETAFSLPEFAHPQRAKKFDLGVLEAGDGLHSVSPTEQSSRMGGISYVVSPG